jgi:hypothetical protein
MGKLLSEQEDAWQAEATASAVADARSIAQSQAGLANTPAGKLSDSQWGWIISAAIFAWIKTRYRQAVAEGLDQEQHVARMDPSPRDSAIVQSILPMLADQSSIDWSKPLAGWSKQEMIGFVGLVGRLIDEAKATLERTPNPIVQHKPERELDDDISDVPFQTPGATC